MFKMNNGLCRCYLRYMSTPHFWFGCRPTQSGSRQMKDASFWPSTTPWARTSRQHPGTGCLLARMVWLPGWPRRLVTGRRTSRKKRCRWRWPGLLITEDGGDRSISTKMASWSYLVLGFHILKRLSCSRAMWYTKPIISCYQCFWGFKNILWHLGGCSN